MPDSDKLSKSTSILPGSDDNFGVLLVLITIALGG